ERHASSPTPKMAMRIVRWRIYHSISFYRTHIMLDFIDLALQSLAQVSDAAPDGATLASSAASAAGSMADQAASAPGATLPLAGSNGALSNAEMGQGTGFLHFIEQSDIVGKSLFGILLLMSLISWYLIVVKLIMRLRLKRRSAHFLREF